MFFKMFSSFFLQITGLKNTMITYFLSFKATYFNGTIYIQRYDTTSQY